jgi:hypothetical protein
MGALLCWQFHLTIVVLGVLLGVLLLRQSAACKPLRAQTPVEVIALNEVTACA